MERYKLDRQIGKGSYGAVYLAHLKIDACVATRPRGRIVATASLGGCPPFPPSLSHARPCRVPTRATAVARLCAATLFDYERAPARTV